MGDALIIERREIDDAIAEEDRARRAASLAHTAAVRAAVDSNDPDFIVGPATVYRSACRWAERVREHRVGAARAVSYRALTVFTEAEQEQDQTLCARAEDRREVAAAHAAYRAIVGAGGDPIRARWARDERIGESFDRCRRTLRDAVLEEKFAAQAREARV